MVSRITSAFLTAAWWFLVGARLMLDLIGYSTAPEDVGVAQTRLDQFIGWLFSVPWWAVLGVALVSTLWLIRVSWPSHKQIDAVNMTAGVASVAPRPIDGPVTQAHQTDTVDPMDATEGDAHDDWSCSS